MNKNYSDMVNKIKINKIITNHKISLNHIN